MGRVSQIRSGGGEGRGRDEAWGQVSTDSRKKVPRYLIWLVLVCIISVRVHVEGNVFFLSSFPAQEARETLAGEGPANGPVVAYW